MTRVFAVMIWAVVLAYFTCSRDPFHFTISGFNAIHRPHFSDLGIMDIHLLNSFWVVCKLGHFSGFLILDCLLLNLTKKRRVSLMISILFAVSTELAQLFMGRDGRFYDMVIDTSGAILAYYWTQFNGLRMSGNLVRLVRSWGKSVN